MTPHVLRQRLACLFLLALSLLFAPWAQAASHSVRLPNQEYREVHEDLAVKVLGGHIRTGNPHKSLRLLPRRAGQ